MTGSGAIRRSGPEPTVDREPISVRSGSSEIRLARNAAEIEAAQQLRYRVFYEEMGAVPSPEARRARLDWDRYDAVADHLLVIDHEDDASIVATYRLTRREVAESTGGYYTAGEYDIGQLVATPGTIMELGRSCVEARYRTRTTMKLLWTGIAAYVFRHDIRLMFGCASFHGVDPDRHAVGLSYLHHHHRAPVDLRPRALDALYVNMDRVPPDAIDTRRAFANLPPLIKGYLRLGGWVGEGAVIDRQFNTTDVCVVVRTESVTRKYYRHYARAAGDATAR
ncbi:MAG: GNAT family N-acetyltransferase [Alphaproteobacteria bacterium]|nr:GNAT family N-acetyltransferase [Alphaproteobacteria bacterium]